MSWKYLIKCFVNVYNVLEDTRYLIRVRGFTCARVCVYASDSGGFFLLQRHRIFF